MVRNHRGRGQVSILYLALLAVATLLVVVLAVRQVWRSSTSQAWVTKDGVKAGETLDSSKLVLASISKDTLPLGLVTDPNMLIGKKVQRPVDKGSPITVGDVTPPPAFRVLSDAPPEGRVIMTVRGNAMSIPVGQLQYGDRLELVSSSEGKTRVVGHRMIFLASMSTRSDAPRSSAATLMASASATRRPSSGGLALVVAVDPSDVTPISEALSSGSMLTYVLHGRQEITSGRPVEIASHEASGQVELIVGATRETVK
jgi:hypothetical protein